MTIRALTHPLRWLYRSAITAASVSVVPPAGNGTIMVMVGAGSIRATATRTIKRRG
jgi:hypothetical protein